MPLDWPTPVGASELIPAHVQDDDHQRWLDTRRQGLGGSDIAAVLGVHRYKTGYEVWLDKTGQLPPLDQTFLLERGHRFESACAQWFADETGLSCRRTGTWCRDDEPWMRANPDRFTSDGAGYEGKIVGEDWGKDWRYGPAQHAALQSLWCMAVTGLDTWYLAAAMDNRFQWWRFDRAAYADEIDEIVDRCALWWYRHITCGDPPPVDGSEATSDALKRAYAQPEPQWRRYIDPEPLSHMVEVPGLADLSRRRRGVKDQIKKLEAELRLLENQITAGMGPALIGLDHGQPVLMRPVMTRTDVDRDAAREQAPHLFVKNNYRTLKEY